MGSNGELFKAVYDVSSEDNRKQRQLVVLPADSENSEMEHNGIISKSFEKNMGILWFMLWS